MRPPSLPFSEYGGGQSGRAVKMSTRQHGRAKNESKLYIHSHGVSWRAKGQSYLLQYESPLNVLIFIVMSN